MKDYVTMADDENVARAAEETATKAVDKASGVVRQMTDSIRNLNINDYRDRVMDAMDNVRGEVDKNVDNVKSGISDRPLESVAIAMGAGLLMGAAITLMGRHAVKKSART